MSEGTGLDNKISRRDFLKKLGLGASTILLSNVLVACDKLTPEEMKITYKEVKNGDSLPLYISGRDKPENVYIQNFFPDLDPLQIRQKEARDIALPFKDGAETARMLGEVTNPTLFKVKGKNSSLGDEITVGVYPSVTGNLVSTEGRHDLNFSDNLYAIPVIVANQSYFEDDAPAEVNKGEKFKINAWREVENFGSGLMVGMLGEDNRFMASGYVCDARAVVLE